MKNFSLYYLHPDSRFCTDNWAIKTSIRVQNPVDTFVSQCSGPLFLLYHVNIIGRVFVLVEWFEVSQHLVVCFGSENISQKLVEFLQ